ncbi:MAG: HpcH/HpaI aldolase/citrate lyase family protein [Alphaproteobacteria bacterium]
MVRDNPVKAALASGHSVLGCWLHLASPIAAEIVALAGYDFVLIDHEHGPGNLLNGISLMQAVSGTGAATMMRVPWNDPVYLKRALDTGIEGVMIPAIDDAEAARRAVAACRYPPAGVRGCAYPIIRAADYGLRAEDYARCAAENLIVMCQIESRRAVDNIAEIAAVDGVDVLFIGPFDLSADIGKPGRFDDPEVVTTLARAEAAILASGKTMAGIARENDDAPAMFDRGYRIVVRSSDLTLLRDSARAEVAAHRPRE